MLVRFMTDKHGVQPFTEQEQAERQRLLSAIQSHALFDAFSSVLQECVDEGALTRVTPAEPLTIPQPASLQDFLAMYNVSEHDTSPLAMELRSKHAEYHGYYREAHDALHTIQATLQHNHASLQPVRVVDNQEHRVRMDNIMQEFARTLMEVDRKFLPNRPFLDPSARHLNQQLQFQHPSLMGTRGMPRSVSVTSAVSSQFSMPTGLMKLSMGGSAHGTPSFTASSSATQLNGISLMHHALSDTLQPRPAGAAATADDADSPSQGSHRRQRDDPGPAGAAVDDVNGADVDTGRPKRSALRNKAKKPKPSFDDADSGDDGIRGRKKRAALPKEAVQVLRRWLFDHFSHPYPSEDNKVCSACRAHSLLIDIAARGILTLCLC